MNDFAQWDKELGASVTVTDANGIILWMNDMARSKLSDGRDLVGQNVFDCHPEPSRTMTINLYKSRQPNHYTISKAGQRKIIHQMPWSRDGVFAGFVEISIPIPETLPHKVRQPKP